MSLILPSIGAFGHTAAGGAYTPEYVDNQGTADVILTGSFNASDNTDFWASMWVNFTNDATSLEPMFETAGRSEIRRELQTINFLIKSPTTTLLDINTANIAAGNLTHIFFTFDGTASTGGWTLYINGSDASGSVSTTTAWQAGSVDHTRATASLLHGVDVQQVGDVLLGANTPPALSAVYNGGPVDPTSVTATWKFVGTASYWNANPNSWATSGTFVDS